jgi:hypothetical protein
MKQIARLAGEKDSGHYCGPSTTEIRSVNHYQYQQHDRGS